MMNEVFHLVPPKAGPYLAVVILGFVVLAIVVLMLLLVLSSRGTTLSVTQTELRVHSLFYSARMPLSEVDIAETAAVNLSYSSLKSPTIRLFGLGVAGLQLGWFRLKDGTKALLFVTERSHVAYIPTKKLNLLVSVPDPMALKAAMKKARAQ